MEMNPVWKNGTKYTRKIQVLQTEMQVLYFA